ncbi:MAG: hypothetical protein JWN67_1739 [Actinomycetia bacterium]|nr:hypothetical protein [Actinomycetes bacterium]
MASRLPLAIEPDVDGPKVRLGVLWFVVSVGAALVDQALLAVVLAVAAGFAADQVVRLQGKGEAGVLDDPLRLPAVLAAAALPLAAVVGTDTLAGAAAASVLVVLVHRIWSGPVGGAVGDVALVLVAAVPVGLAAAAPVLVAELAPAAAVVLLVLVAAYDAGDFLVGTGAGNPWEGPAAGIVAVAVCGFGAWVVAPPPLEGHGVVALAVATAVLAPFGPPAASVLIGDGGRPARFVRRLDTLIVLGPVAAWAAAGVVR